MIIESLIENARRQPKRVIAKDPSRSLTCVQLCKFSQAMRSLVQSQTVCDRVGVMLPASVAGLGTLMGSLWAGRTIVPLNFLLKPDELRLILQDAGIDLVITTEHFASITEALPVRSLFLEQAGLKKRYLWSRLRRSPPPPQTKPNDVAALVYTSGTSGQPKGVCLTYNNFLSNARAAIEHMRMGPESHFLGVLPSFHVFGLTVLTFIPVVLGAAVTYVPRFSAQAAYQAIRDTDISILMAVPSMFSAISRLKDLDRSAFGRIQLAVSGGEPLPKGVYDLFGERTGLTLLEGYGMTETSPIIFVDAPWNHRVGTVGTPLPGVEIQVRDHSGRVLETGQEGELFVRGSLVMKGYHQRPLETGNMIGPDGWLRTGDIVRIEEEQHIRITGRAKELIIVGGENVYPREVEIILERHPAVAAVAVMGQQDNTRGEAVVAYVSLEEGSKTTPQHLREYCREHLAGYKVPRQIHILPELPRGPTGKVLKKELAGRDPVL
ncbi:MAG: long-chain fatty acid--CoA ligase [Phycisphaerales bacterium]|nr:long-chain fatty acid--CoA ligase [Phycisphaerales bacterium]